MVNQVVSWPRDPATDAYNDKMRQFDTGKLAGHNDGRGYNQTSCGGHPFYVLDVRSEDISITEIAMQLSRICRFNGALRSDIEIYSVAQHCCLVSDHLPTEFKLEGLLHDAHEYMVGDMSKPIKMNLAILSHGVDYWKQLERGVESAIRRKFGLPSAMSWQVKEQDYYAVATEHRDLQVVTGEVDWGKLPKPWPDKIVPWSVFKARDEFLLRFSRLYEGEW